MRWYFREEEDVDRLNSNHLSTRCGTVEVTGTRNGTIPRSTQKELDHKHDRHRIVISRGPITGPEVVPLSVSWKYRPIFGATTRRPKARPSPSRSRQSYQSYSFVASVTGCCAR
ncbi:uncharacterized protein LOC143203701 [Rhynchophorus ferrugineus]|uniref:uncharacterized protein LOC143203701 n=1 Tax=Rhynchophorus ferrugineus TaxID=354439 RepID=UPI003FCD538C